MIIVFTKLKKLLISISPVLLLWSCTRTDLGSNSTNNPSNSNSCVVIIGKNLNVRTSPGGGVTGKLVQIGTNVSSTGQEKSNWIEISSPVQGWIWKENTTNDCSQAVSPNPGVIESKFNSASTSTDRNSQTPPLCRNGKPADWFEGRNRFSCIGQDRDNSSSNTVDNTSSLGEKSSTDNSQKISACYEDNENLSSAQRAAKCGCEPGFILDLEQGGCVPTKDNPSGEILN